jgi:hypothetical protein
MTIPVAQPIFVAVFWGRGPAAASDLIRSPADWRALAGVASADRRRFGLPNATGEGWQAAGCGSSKRRGTSGGRARRAATPAWHGPVIRWLAQRRGARSRHV